MKRITFRAEEHLIEEARRVAESQNTTLTGAFREWLKAFASEASSTREFDNLMTQLRHVRAGRRFTRDERERMIARGNACSLLSPREADAGREGSVLASRKLAEIGGIHVVYHHVGVSAIQSVYQFDARGPQVSAECELLFQRDV